MSEQSAIICLPDDRDITGLKKPLMLQPMSGSPLLSWMVRLMRDSGYTRFLLSCDDEFRDAALACFPAFCCHPPAGPEPKASDLRAFLSQADDQLLVVTAPALLGGKALGGVSEAAQTAEDAGMLEGCGCYTVSAESIASVMDAANFDLGRFASVLGTELTEADGAMAFPDPGAVADFQTFSSVCATTISMPTAWKSGISNNCYVGPFAEVAPVQF